MTADLPVSTCSSCHGPIIWTVAAGGRQRRMPVDAVPHPDGNIWLGGREPIRAHVLTRAQHRNRGLLPDGTDLYRSHFASCPNAAHHRKA